MTTPDITPAAPVPPTGLQLVPTKNRRIFMKDMAERALSTFWQGAVSVLILAQPTTHWSELKTVGASALVGGLAAVASAGKSYFVRYQGIHNSTSASSSV